ncbi:MAG TPA: zinc-dependent metalloprotease [Chthonomonadaceae bacterium]|nr:zinc-dependent metalloprotease [Chthonomonadaceae bacterium]
MRAPTSAIRTLGLVALFSAALSGAFAQGGQGPGGFGGGGFRQRGAGGGGGAVSAGPRPYAEVITDTAKSEPGVFTVHRIGERVLYEIPENMFNRVMLWSTEIAQVPANAGYGGTAVGHKIIRWTRRGNKVYLRLVDTSVRAEGTGAIRTAIAAATLEPIVAAFDVEAEGKDKSAVIDVTRLLNSDTTEFSVRSRLGGSAVDPTRSYIENVKAFPTNVEVRTLYTFAGGGGGGGFQLPTTPDPAPNPNPDPSPTPTPLPTPGPRPGRRGPGGGAPAFARGGGSSVTALIHYSMTLLPEEPMMGRLADSRVGFFSDSYQDYGRDEHRVVDRAFINRYRLEKKDLTAKLSEPIKPIVYYVSREVPEKWRPAMHKAVEAWNAAFEEAGFKNAIVCKDAPTVVEDPNWDPEDARYSVIRWAPTPTENAQGPHVSDPRSGEIISAHIIVWHNVLKLGETWYFTQVGPLDPRAAHLPLPDSLMSDIVEYVVKHEVGHTLGLYHNFKASSSYTVAQLRSKEFTEKYGDEASIMDYGRFNYVAQPGDNAHLIPMLGPYDKFAISWGYTPIGGVHTPDDEKQTLDDWASKQVMNPTLRFGHAPEAGDTEDPTQQTEDLGSDPIEATRYGLKNIARVAQMLPTAAVKYGEDYDLLHEMYDATLAQRQRELGHVASLVGGVIETDYHVGRGGDTFKYVPKDQQAKAVRFLVENGFSTPRELLVPDILFRIGPSGVADRILANQRTLLTTLLQPARIKRLADFQAISPNQAYTLAQLVTELQAGIWSELSAPHPVMDLYRRNLQRAYLETMKPVLASDTTTGTELRPIARGALKELMHSINVALPRVTDHETMLHLQDCSTQIDRILNPKS